MTENEESIIVSLGSIIKDYREFVEFAGYKWIIPKCGKEDEELVLDWYKGKHSLHLSIDGKEIEYIKVWGININSEMEDGDFNKLDPVDKLGLWRFLLNG